MEIPIGINLPDQYTVEDLGQQLENTVVSHLGVMPRPGLFLSIDTETSAAIDGIYDWQEQDLVILVSNGNVYKIANATFTANDYLELEEETGFFLVLEDGSGYLQLERPTAKTDVTGAADMIVGTRVSFANFGDYLYMANGGKIQELHPSQSLVTHGGKNWSCKLNHYSVAGAGGNEPGVATATATYWTDLGAGTGNPAWAADIRYGSGVAQELEDAQAPTAVKFITTADGYLLAIEDLTEFLWFSYPWKPWQWDGDVVSAEHLPDLATCMLSMDSNIYVGGKRSIQIFQNDGVTPWIPSVYGALSHGVLAPYSFVFCKSPGVLVWINDQKRLVTLTGRNVESLHESLDTFIKELAEVRDAVGDFVVMEGIPHYILQFPSEDVTISINMDTGVWSKWTSGSAQWLGNCIASVPGWGKILCGSRVDGKMYEVGIQYPDDNGTDMSIKLRSPRMPSMGVQRTPRLLMHFTRLAPTLTTSNPSITVRWRDDGKDWVTARTVTLDGFEKTDFVRYLTRLGHYRFYRQYEFDCTNMWPFSLAKVEQV